MVVVDQIKKFQDFLEDNYLAILSEKVRKGEKFLVIDFSLLANFDPELADALLEEPEDSIKAAELALENFDLGDIKGFRVRFTNLPKSQEIMIRDIRSKHIGGFVSIRGVVRQKSDVRPQVTTARFECPACGQIITVLQLDSAFKEPTKCSCGRKGKFRLLSKELVDAQGIVLEEVPEDLEGGDQPKRINILLKDDLVSPMSEKKTQPGSKILVMGIIKEIPIILRSGSKSIRSDLMIEANYVESVEETFYEIGITKKEEQEIKKMANDPKLIKKLINSIAPSIFGYDRIKEALILQLAGGVQKTRADRSFVRGDMHVLLIGDPGSGKSQLLKRIALVAPKGRYISGKGVSAAGLTATVVKDEFLRGWSLEAGAMVLASNGICCTTGDAEFITGDYKKITFEDLFKNANSNFVYPDFKVLALNIKNNKIEDFKIKRAFKIKNDKAIYKIKTRTGREINLTEDNEILTIGNSKTKWKKTEDLTKEDYIAVPNKYFLEGKDNYSKEFAYVCGLIAADGHIKIDRRRAQTSFYNTDEQLVLIFKKNLDFLKVKYGTFIQKKGRQSIIRGRKIYQKKDVYQVYNSGKGFAEKIIKFGVPSGNKSSKICLNKKILGYSNDTLSLFMRGVFDGDGSIRKNPFEITITTGLKENAKLFQEILLRFGMISSVKKSTSSWHCDVRGATECVNFFDLIGSSHPEKFNELSKIKISEVKDRINIIPKHQEFFKSIIKKYRWKLGKNVYKYIWNYTKKGVCPSTYKLKVINKLIQDKELANKINNDILWDKIVSIKNIKADFVYDFTMEGTNNFIANDIIMHNCIDELDKMGQEDRAAMHEALESQTISISKANIQATLLARTTVLAAANPKFGRFDPYDVLAKQIDMPPTLINRFDLIFPIKDLPDKDKDEKMATHILSLHQRPELELPEIPTGLLKKYIAYARQRIKPKLTDGAIEEIKSYYIEMRTKELSEEGVIKTIPISPRQLEALVRLSEASARIRLSDKVLRRDSRRAIDLLHHCLIEVGLDQTTGKIDIDKIITGITASQRGHIVIIKEIIADLESRIGKTIPIDDVLKAASDAGIEDTKVEEVLERLKRSGDVFEPRRGFIQRI